MITEKTIKFPVFWALIFTERKNHDFEMDDTKIFL